MHVGHVGVSVLDTPVLVEMSVGFFEGFRTVVRVTMVFIVHMRM